MVCNAIQASPQPHAAADDSGSGPGSRLGSGGSSPLFGTQRDTCLTDSGKVGGPFSFLSLFPSLLDLHGFRLILHSMISPPDRSAKWHRLFRVDSRAWMITLPL